MGVSVNPVYDRINSGILVDDPQRAGKCHQGYDILRIIFQPLFSSWQKSDCGRHRGEVRPLFFPEL